MTKAQKIFYKYSQMTLVTKAITDVLTVGKNVAGQILPGTVPAKGIKAIKFSPKFLPNKNTFNALSKAGKGTPKP